MPTRRSPMVLLQVLAFAACGMGTSAKPPEKSSGATAEATPTPASQSSNQPSDRRTQGLPGCRFERPEVWPAGAVSWIGNCRNGFAEDSGVIVMKINDAESEHFYGRVQGGRLSVGVLQSANGFMAGTWANGTLTEALPDDVAQRNKLIAAFRVAANAASSVSKSFAEKGDATASRFYAMQAKLLREQMD